jgi:hypothetical protein
MTTETTNDFRHGFTVFSNNGKTRTAIKIRPPLTHGQAVDHFPILRGIRVGFDRGQDARLTNALTFLAECRIHGSGAEKCGRLVLSLIGMGGILMPSLNDVIASVDSEHKRAIKRAINAVIERGIK